MIFRLTSALRLYWPSLPIFLVSSALLLVALTFVLHKHFATPAHSRAESLVRQRIERGVIVLLMLLATGLAGAMLVHLFVVASVFPVPVYAVSLIALTELTVTATILNETRGLKQRELLLACVAGSASAAWLASLALLPPLHVYSTTLAFFAFAVTVALLDTHTDIRLGLRHATLSTGTMLFWMVLTFSTLAR